MCVGVNVLTLRNDIQGMKLGGASKSKNILETLIKEDHLVSIPSAHKASGGGAEAAVPAAVVAASVNPVSLSVEERLSCQVWIAFSRWKRIIICLAQSFLVCFCCVGK